MEVKKQIKNKKLISNTQKILKNDNEIVLITLKLPFKSFQLHSIMKNYENAKKQKKILESKGYIVHLCFKSKGNKHTAAYLNDFGNSICISYGINRTLEVHNKYLRSMGNKILQTKINKEKSGYIGFAFHYPSGVYVSTQLYDSYNNALSHISKRSGIDNDSIDIIDSSRLYNGKFRFSHKKYEDLYRIKHVKKSKLEERVGQEEAAVILNTIEEQRKNNHNKKEQPIKINSIETLTENIDEDKTIRLLKHVINKMQETQLYILNNEKEIENLEKSLALSKIEKAKKLSNKANNSAIVAQELIKILLDINNVKDNNIKA